MEKINFNFLYFLVLFYSKILIIKTNKIFNYSHVKGSSLSIQAGPLSSKKAIIPYGYPDLNICNSKKIKRMEDTLGEILTEYLAKTNIDSFCNVLCYNEFSEKDVNLIEKLPLKKHH